MDRTIHIRKALPEDHILLLVYIEHSDKISSFKPSTVTKWVKGIIQSSGIDIAQYNAHTIRLALTIKAIEEKSFYLNCQETCEMESKFKHF